MKFSYKFSNLLGSVFSGGNVVFTPDGTTLISPVGNKVSTFNLKSHKSETLPVECTSSVRSLAIDPTGVFLLVVTAGGDALYINIVSHVVVHRNRLSASVSSVSFSPDGRKIAVCRDTDVQIFSLPNSCSRVFNPFHLESVYHVAHDTITCVEWSQDAKVIAVGAKDMQTRVVAAEKYDNLFIYSLGGHTSPIVKSFFETHSLDMYTVEKQGFACVWECSLTSDQLVSTTSKAADVEVIDGAEKPMPKFFYKKLKRYSFHEAVPGSNIYLLSADFHKRTKMLVTGFNNGSFLLHELPEFNLIHSLSISDEPIQTVALNCTGDWIAVGCGELGQLLVWEWQSESFVLKQQGHVQNTTCLGYSPDGQFIATGSLDGKVKLWNVSDGFCFATFTEHTSGVTGVTWIQGGKALLTSSLDGTVRAFDVKRYRNFRTFTSPQPTQFSCVAVDPSGEIVCAGSNDTFEVFVWTIQTGRLLEILSGHEAPVSGLSFCKIHSVLASCSWDKTVRVWDIFESKGGKEVIALSSDALAVEFSPNGVLLAVATLDCQISIHDWKNNVQIGCIEGRLDLDPGRGETDQVTAQKSGQSKAFSTICFSANGEYILAGGQSRFVCIYNVEESILVKKFQITCNLSLDSVSEDIDRRKMSQFGNLALVDASDSDEEGAGKKKKIKLPGVRTGDLSQRSLKPEIRVSSLEFSPSGRAWAACTTEGLLIYSLDRNLLFDPYQLDTSVTPDRIRKAVETKEFAEALLMALKLNQVALIVEVLESTPLEEVEFVCRSLPDLFVDKLIDFLGGNATQSSPHVQFYLTWIHQILLQHGAKLKLRSADVMAQLTSLQQTVSKRHEELSRLCEFNTYTIRYILELQRRKQKKVDTDEKGSDDEGNLIDD